MLSDVNQYYSKMLIRRGTQNLIDVHQCQLRKLINVNQSDATSINRLKQGRITSLINFWVDHLINFELKYDGINID